jgi:hypothetical protein
LETELNLNPDSNPVLNQELIMDPDPNLQIISDPDAQHCQQLLTTYAMGLDGLMETIPQVSKVSIPF